MGYLSSSVVCCRGTLHTKGTRALADEIKEEKGTEEDEEFQCTLH